MNVGTGGRKCRFAVINSEMFPTSPIITISVEVLLPERGFMLDRSAEDNLIEARSVHPDTQILSEDELPNCNRWLYRITRLKSHASDTA